MPVYRAQRSKTAHGLLGPVSRVLSRSVCGITGFAWIFAAFWLTFNCTYHPSPIYCGCSVTSTDPGLLLEKKMACAQGEFEIHVSPSLCFCTVSQEAININSKSKGHVHCPCEVCSGEPVYPTTAWRHIQRSKKAKFANSGAFQQSFALWLVTFE